MKSTKNSIDKNKNFFGNNRSIQDNSQDSELGKMVYNEPNVYQVPNIMINSLKNDDQNKHIDNQQKGNAHIQSLEKNKKNLSNNPNLEYQSLSHYDEEIFNVSTKNIINLGSTGGGYEYNIKKN